MIAPSKLTVDEFSIARPSGAQPADVEALARAVTALQEVRERLVPLGHDSTGRYMMTGDWGSLQGGHGARAAATVPDRGGVVFRPGNSLRSAQGVRMSELE